MGFGNGAFQAAKIAIDKITIVQNPNTGKIQTSISAVVTYDGTTISENSSGQLEVNLANANDWTETQTFSKSIKIDVSQNTVIGTTAGTIVYSEPFIGASYKKVIVYLDSYVNSTTTAQTITYSDVFSTFAVIIYNNTGLTITEVSTSLTVLTIDPDSTTTYSGSLIIEGY